MDRLLVLVVVAAVAGLVATLLQGWRPGGSVATGWSVPGHLDRSDFDGQDVPWLVAVFSATNCATCVPMVAEAHTLAGDRVFVQEVPIETANGLHSRYRIDAVPMVVVADGEGLVRAHHLGQSAPGELRTLLQQAFSSRS